MRFLTLTLLRHRWDLNKSLFLLSIVKKSLRYLLIFDFSFLGYSMTSFAIGIHDNQTAGRLKLRFKYIAYIIIWPGGPQKTCVYADDSKSHHFYPIMSWANIKATHTCGGCQEDVPAITIIHCKWKGCNLYYVKPGVNKSESPQGCLWCVILVDDD